MVKHINKKQVANLKKSHQPEQAKAIVTHVDENTQTVNVSFNRSVFSNFIPNFADGVSNYLIKNGFLTSDFVSQKIEENGEYDVTVPDEKQWYELMAIVQKVFDDTNIMQAVFPMQVDNMSLAFNREGSRKIHFIDGSIPENMPFYIITTKASQNAALFDFTTYMQGVFIR